MTDKSLNATGIPLTAQMGKHDFRQYATTNSVAQPAEIGMESLTKAMKILEAMPPEEERIDHARVGKDYLKMLESHCTVVESKPTFGGGMLGSFTGMNIIRDDDLPPDVCEFCNKAGKVLYAVNLRPQP